MLHTTILMRAFAPVAIGVLALTADAGAQQLQYHVEVMEGMSVYQGVHLRMNNRNQVIGGGNTPANENSPVMLWSPATGAVPLTGGPGLRVVIAYDINDSGRICGMGKINDGPTRTIVGDTPDSLHPIDDGSGTAYAVNNAGDVLGTTNLAEGVYASIWLNSGLRTDLPTPGADNYMFVLAINNNSDSAGIAASPTHPSLPTIWPAGGAPRRLALPMTPDAAYVHGINLRRDVVGVTTFPQGTSSVRRATLWRENEPALSLGVLDGFTRSLALAVSEFGYVVGQSSNNGVWSWVTGGSAFAWTPVTGMMSLDSLLVPADASWHIIAACDINDHGDIAAYARQGTNPIRAVILHPHRVNLADIAATFGATLPDGQLNADDVITFINEFFSNAPVLADVSGPGGLAGPDGRLTVDDVIVFIAAFFGGE